MAAERTITATKLRRDLGAVLDAVLKGETIRVERSGRPLAVLVPPDRFDGMTVEIEQPRLRAAVLRAESEEGGTDDVSHAS
jgi:prevent-host-death family protein